MPHWTSEDGDKVVYTTVDEAHSGSVDDVSSFLLTLKNKKRIACLTKLTPSLVPRPSYLTHPPVIKNMKSRERVWELDPHTCVAEAF